MDGVGFMELPARSAILIPQRGPTLLKSELDLGGGCGSNARIFNKLAPRIGRCNHDQILRMDRDRSAADMGMMANHQRADRMPRKLTIPIFP